MKFNAYTTLAFALLTTACSDDTTAESSPQAVHGSELRVCSYDAFSVEVTAGPSAGTTLAGRLVVIDDVLAHTFEGRLTVGEQMLKVVGAHGDPGPISLNVETPAGFVAGVGPLAVDLCATGAAVQGVAVGPVVGADNAIADTDTGHWLLSGLQATSVVSLEDASLVFADDLAAGEGMLQNITVRIPESVLGDCSRRTGRGVYTCLQGFCTAQQAGDLTADGGGLACTR